MSHVLVGLLEYRDGRVCFETDGGPGRGLQRALGSQLGSYVIPESFPGAKVLFRN